MASVMSVDIVTSDAAELAGFMQDNVAHWHRDDPDSDDLISTLADLIGEGEAVGAVWADGTVVATFRPKAIGASAEHGLAYAPAT